MLKLRILTALLLIPVFVLGVIYLDGHGFALMMALVIILAAWEWSAIAGYSKYSTRTGYLVSVGALMGLVYVLRAGSMSLLLNLIVVPCWFAVLWLIIRYQKGEGRDFSLPLPAVVIGVLVLVPPWISLVVLRATEPDGTNLVLFLLVLIWSADIAAYFCGRRWGRNRLCSRVSPGKSWEGLYAALTAAIIIAVIVAIQQRMWWVDLLVFVSICMLTVMASILGDLLESLMKRRVNMKDSGTILPGHGGVLDRIDSLTAAVPVFTLSMSLWGKSG